jgi:aryl-phospho-beta-D-glucosidase BglC (GH1 family)
LVSVNSELCLDVAAARVEDAAVVQQWTCNNTDAQRFALRSLGSNDYELRAVHSGKCLDVRAASTANGAVVQQYACNGTAAQRWRIIDLGSGQYQLRPETAENLCLDVANVSREPGAPVQQYGCWEQARNQRWWLNKTSGGGSGGGGGTGGGPTTGTPVQQHGALKVVGTALVDQYDRPVQLKGISSMWLNWQSKPYAENKEALRWMRDNWNVSVFRAAMGVEPQGAYLSDPNRALRQLETIVQNAVELGVYVIIDWHAHEAFKNTRAAQDFFYNMAAKWGDKPNVLYETFNEPLAVNWSSTLKPYHEAVVGAIRAKDPDNVIILGTPNWSQDVDAAAGDPLRSSANLMYTLHFYSCTHGQWLRDKANAALSRGLPIFVTEWGATHADGGMDGVVCTDEAQRWMTWMATRKISHAAWKLDDCEPDASCLLKPGAPVNGGWTDNWLRGHATFVRASLLD